MHLTQIISMKTQRQLNNDSISYNFAYTLNQDPIKDLIDQDQIDYVLYCGHTCASVHHIRKVTQ